MAHWCETYPHKIYASVLLKNNKIKAWKTGENRLNQKYSIEAIEAHPEYSYQEKCWEVNNSEEHCRVFSELSRQWFRQWEIHEDFKGDSPHEDDGLKPGDVVTGTKFKIIMPLKEGE